MKIQVTDGVGEGPTPIAAFDQALINANIANFNLIYLSSIVPPDSDIEITKHPKVTNSKWGDKLYVVIAQQRTARRNHEAWAGIGWVQDPKTKQGLFVEHEGRSESEVREDITNSLEAMQKARGQKSGKINMHVVGKKCVDLPVCALVVAVFESVTWKKPNALERLIK